MKKEHFLQSEGFKTVAASVLSILIGLAVGSIVILIVGLTSPNLSLSSAWDGIRIVFGGLFSTGRDASGTLMWGFNPTNIGNMLFRAAPLIMTGLSVGMAYKTGLFNIGAPGQYLIGTLVSLSIALGLPSETMSTTLIWLLAFLGGTLAGALWGAIPGLFKALLNINEVLACIMTNWIAANLVTWLFDISSFKNVAESTKTGYIYKTTYNGVATAKMGLDKLFPNSQVNGGILIAIVFAIGVYVMMSKTTFGYQLKACGSNRHAARYAGIADKRNIVLSMAIAGGLSAAGPFLFDPLQEKVSEKCFYATRGKLVPAVLGNEAGMVGAASLLVNGGAFGFEGALSPVARCVYFADTALPPMSNLAYCALQYGFLFLGALYFAGFILIVAALTRRTARSLFLCGGSYLLFFAYSAVGHQLPEFLRVPLDALYRFGFGGYLLQESYSWVFPYLWSDVWKPVLLGIGMILLEFFLFWRIWRRKMKA